MAQRRQSRARTKLGAVLPHHGPGPSGPRALRGAGRTEELFTVFRGRDPFQGRFGGTLRPITFQSDPMGWRAMI